MSNSMYNPFLYCCMNNRFVRIRCFAVHAFRSFQISQWLSQRLSLLPVREVDAGVRVRRSRVVPEPVGSHGAQCRLLVSTSESSDALPTDLVASVDNDHGRALAQSSSTSSGELLGENRLSERRCFTATTEHREKDDFLTREIIYSIYVLNFVFCLPLFSLSMAITH